jgi:hypothetical protein
MMNDVAIEETEILAADKQDQDSIKTEQTKDIRFMEKSSEIVAPDTSKAEGSLIHQPAADDAPLSQKSNEVTKIQPLFGLPIPVPIEATADEMFSLIKQYCVMTDHEVNAIVLWLISSHTINAFRIFSKLALISPEKRCGKTSTLEVLTSLSNEGVLVSNISGPAIFRITEKFQPTLFIDEADMLLKKGDPILVGLINSSHTKAGANVVRCVGENHETQIFSTWMPMGLASIGELPPTIMDRCIVVNLRRKKSHEHTDQIPEDLVDLNKGLREKVLLWCKANERAIRASITKPPNLGNDRAADNWSPLFAVAKNIGGTWPDRCEKAYKVLTNIEEVELPTQLLSDIRHTLREYRDQKIPSEELINKLCDDDTGPWLSCNNGKRITPSYIAQLLKPYGIKPKAFRLGEKTKRGYEKSQFDDAFERYLPSTTL